MMEDVGKLVVVAVRWCTQVYSKYQIGGNGKALKKINKLGMRIKHEN